MEIPGLSDLAGNILEPDGEFETGVLYGRFNPPSNNHIRVAEYAAEKHGLDYMDIYVVNSPGSPRNPMRPEEVEESLRRTFDERDNDFDVNIHTHDIEGLENLFWRDLDIPDNSVYYTADIQHALLGGLRKLQSPDGLEVDYEPRYLQDIHQENDTPKSGSEVREAIREGSSWRKYVPSGTVDVIENNPEIKQRIENGNVSGPGKHLEILSNRFSELNSNG